MDGAALSRLLPHHTAAAALATAHSKRPAGTPATTPAGVLVGRPDLSEEEVCAAIRERLAFDGRTGPDPAVVLEAARLGKRKALTFLQKLVLPPPRVSLDMPIQAILRSQMGEGTDDASGHGVDTRAG